MNRNMNMQDSKVTNSSDIQEFVDRSSKGERRGQSERMYELADDSFRAGNSSSEVKKKLHGQILL